MSRRSSLTFSSSRAAPGRGHWRAFALVIGVLAVIVGLWAAAVGGVWAWAWLQLGGDHLEVLDDEVAPLGAGGAAAPATSTTVLVTLTGPVDPTVPRPPELVASPMLVQVGGPREQPAVLVLPSQLEVTVDGRGAMPLGEVQAEGGSELLTRAVVDYTQVRVDHVVSFSIDALPRLYELLGGGEGLEVCTPDGCSTPTPDELRLALARSDDEGVAWTALGTLRAVGERFDRGFVVRSPLTAKRVVDVVADEVATDASLRGTTLLMLADAFASVRDVDLDAVPIVGDPSGEGSTLVLEEPAAVRFQHLREGTPFTGERIEDVESDLVASFEVALLNAAGIDGLAGSVQVRLGAAGFVVAGTGNAPTFDRETTSVTYASGDSELAYVATLLAEELGDASLEPLDQQPTFEGEPVDLLVLLGADQDRG